MLNTLGDIKNDVLVKLNQSTTTGYYTDAILGGWINDANKWAGSFKKWPVTEGRVSTTYASLVSNEDGILTGVYPEGWKPDSIRRLTIGGKKVDKREFYSFLEFLEENSSASDRIYSNFGSLYYINPRIDLSGTVTAWGQFVPADMDLSIPTSLTIFSGALDNANEAIVLEVLSYAKKKEKLTKEAQAYHLEAIAVLEGVWNIIQDNASDYETADTGGMFERFDVLDGRPNDGYHRDRFD